MKPLKKHQVNPYIINPAHPITVLVIGAGGNGSLILTQLARLHFSLIALEHQGLDVTVIDPDIVEESNIGRQAFSFHDIGQPKARIVTERLNMFYKLSWKWQQTKVEDYRTSSNIIITCTDNKKSRQYVHSEINRKYKNDKKFKILRTDHTTNLYWLDLGNLKDRGQVILSTPDRKLKSVIEYFGKDYENPDPEQEPSCSLAQALQKQDLCINPMMSTFAIKILWDLFTRLELDYHGFFINLELLIFNKIPI